MKYSLKALLPQLLSVFLFTSAFAAEITVADSGNLQKKPLLNGTFIQLVEQNGNWNRARWEKLFDSLRAVGLQQVVIQWTLHDNRAFYSTTTFTPVELTPLETILALAEERGMDLHLGLAAESRYWDMIKQSPVRQEEYLQRLRWKSERVAQEIAAVATRYKSFKGWYIPEEIDDLTWNPPRSRELLHRHIKDLSGFLKILTPAATVSLSGFTRARVDPDSFESFWQNLLRDTSVDMLLFQDGVGTFKLPAELLPRYLKAVRNATDATGKKLQVIVELFAMASESPFKAASAPILRIRQQLNMAADYATGGITSFSVPDYMSVEGGVLAVELLNDYQKYKGGGHLTTP